MFSHERNRYRHLCVVIVALALAAVSCRATPEVTMTSNIGSSSPAVLQGRELSPPPIDSDDNLFADAVAGGGIDFRLTRDDLDCNERDLNVYPDTPFVVAHVVVNGNLGEPCFGEPDPRLLRAWQILSLITPEGQLRDLGVFSGFRSTEIDQTTLAFVNPLDYDSSIFQMSINLVEAELDPDELMLTMAHEFAHVFTTQPSQIDYDVYPKDCDTWHNLRGCYVEGSLLAEWVDLFWDEGRIEQVNRKQEPSSETGSERCVFDASFLGPYSASHPEEDFAESFSAFVFQLDVGSRDLEEKMEWFARQPGLAEFRNRAVEANLGPLPNRFERCG